VFLAVNFRKFLKNRNVKARNVKTSVTVMGEILYRSPGRTKKRRHIY